MTTAATTLVVVGVLLITLSGLGVLRLPDVYSRLNATTKAAGLGVVLVLAGAALAQPGWANTGKLTLAAVLQLVTVPIGGYAIGRAAYRAGSPLWKHTRYDELAARTRPPCADGGAAGSQRPDGT